MFANLGPGQQVTLDATSPNGIDLAYSHEFIARAATASRNLYEYVDSNPITAS